jgi:hypothetical protein
VKQTLDAVRRPFNPVPRPRFAVLEVLIGVSRTLLIERRVSGAVLHSRQFVSQVSLEFPSVFDTEPPVTRRMPRLPLVAPLVVKSRAAVLGTVLLQVSDDPQTLFVRNRTSAQMHGSIADEGEIAGAVSPTLGSLTRAPLLSY